MKKKSTLSIAVPVYNEEENVRLLFEKIQAVCETIGDAYEVLFVDDGSQDKTFEVLSELCKQAPTLRVIRFEKNAGQTAAMAAGFEFAQGQRIISMDGDLQNDPGDIPKLLEKLDQGYDLVCGWRKTRQDKFWTRRVPSVVANWLIGKVTGVPIHDNGCSLKAYRASVIKQVPLYGEMHRFIPAMSTVAGARIAEIVVTHHPRRFGKSKYGLGRVWRVMLDIIAFKLILSVFGQSNNPAKRGKYHLQASLKGVSPCIAGVNTSSGSRRAFQGAACLSLPFFVLGGILLGTASLAAFSCIGLGASLLGLGAVTARVIGKSQQESVELGTLARFFISRCARRPFRCFGPVGSMLLVLGGILTIWMPNLGPVLMNSGILVCCCGLFGELIVFANAKRVKDYTVETFLNANN